MEIGEVLSRAFHIFWKNKVLWIFGILASCTSTNWGSNGFRQEYRGELPNRFQYFFNQPPNWQIALLVGIIILAIILIIIIAVFLGTMGRIGMIRGTMKADREETPLSFSNLFNGSLPYFWRVFFLDLLVGLAFAALVILVTLVLVVSIIGIACLLPFYCLLAPLAVAVGVVVEQANIAIVVEDLDILSGLRRGWEVVRQNAGAIIVMAVVLILGVSLIGGFLISLPVAVVFAPVIIGLLSSYQTAIRGGVALAAMCLVLYVPVAIVLNGLLQGYIQSAWTITFLRLTHRRVPAVESE